MKKTIYFLSFLAGLNVAYAQSGTLSLTQGYGTEGNKATLTQVGGTVIINQQYGKGGEATLTQTPNGYDDAQLFVGQYGHGNTAKADQSGLNNRISLDQISGAPVSTKKGNVADITQTGDGNAIDATQVSGASTGLHANVLDIKQIGDNSYINVNQRGVALAGNTSILKQFGDDHYIMVEQKGAYNTTAITQDGKNNWAYHLQDNSTSALTGNKLTLIQEGEGNLFNVAVFGDGNIINAKQIGDNNILADAVGSTGTGVVAGGGNTINATQIGDNQHGIIQFSGHGSTINVTSTSY